MSKKKKIHYRDIINAYLEWEKDNYEEARIMLWEKLPYMIGKICTQKWLRINPDWTSHVFMWVDDCMKRWLHNIDYNVYNGINNFLCSELPINYTKYSLQKFGNPIIWDIDFLSDGIIDEDMESSMRNKVNSIIIAEEIRPILYDTLSDVEREVFCATYLWNKQLNYTEIAQAFPHIRRQNVWVILKRACRKIREALPHLMANYGEFNEYTDDEIDCDTIEWDL